MLDPQVAERIPGEQDPALRNELAHQTAQAILSRCHDVCVDRTLDADVIARLVGLVETEGLETVSEIWSSAEPVTLPGALWRLYLLREWVRRDPEAVSLRYRLGVQVAPVAAAVVGIVEAPTPTDLLDLANQVLSGFFAGDLAMALDRASAFCLILASGAAFDADSRDATDPAAANRITRSAANLQRTAEDLRLAAIRARAGTLE